MAACVEWTTHESRSRRRLRADANSFLPAPEVASFPERRGEVFGAGVWVAGVHVIVVELIVLVLRSYRDNGLAAVRSGETEA